MAGRSGSSGGRSGSSGGRSSSGGSSSFGRSSSGGWNNSGRSGSTGSSGSNSSRGYTSNNNNNNNNNGMSDFEKLFILDRATRPRKRAYNTKSYNHNTPNYNPSPKVNTNTYNNNPKNNITSIIVSILVIVLAAIFVNAILSPDDNSSDITKSTVTRTPITQGQELDYYHDDLGWIHSSSTLEEGMKYFFKKTGVQPILYIKGDIDGNNHPNQATVDKWLQETYDATISDESHMIFLLMDDGNGDWGSWAYVGSTAATVIDNEAQTIILNYMSKWYYSDPEQYSEDVMFSNVFKESADRIMKVTPNYSLIILIVFGVLLAAIILINLYIKAQKARKETLEASAEVLNAPLKRPGQQEE